MRLWLGLDPRWLGQLTTQGDRAAALIDYFKTCEQPRPDEKLQQSETWLALEVRQDRDGVQIGFRTYWIYARASVLAAALQASNTVLRDAAQFFQTLTQPGLQVAGQQPFHLAEETERWLAELAELDPQQGLSQSSLLRVAIAFLRADGWPYEPVDEGTLRTQCQGNNGRWVCYVRVREAAQQLLFYSIYPTAVPPEQRAAMSEFVTRANYGVFIGNFELDLNDGELRYKTSIDVEGSQLNANLVKRLVAINVGMMDEYWPGIERVLAGEQ
ncbi:MAG: YbjN domain-containing protein, partial [Spirulinaceae cyanobacterium SM2_1_0]|nr:YbjN domain-containing protein [Spirulinaceae cyanobacterium SM2_1_0]